MSSSRPLTLKHVRALVALEAEPAGELTLEQLRASIGNYSTNVLLSLTVRGLVAEWYQCHTLRPARLIGYAITDAGRSALAEIGQELSHYVGSRESESSSASSSQQSPDVGADRPNREKKRAPKIKGRRGDRGRDRSDGNSRNVAPRRRGIRRMEGH